MKVNWIALWIKLFGATEFLGINMGFWVSMAVVAIIVIVMNVVFWGMKPKKRQVILLFYHLLGDTLC